VRAQGRRGVAATAPQVGPRPAPPPAAAGSGAAAAARARWPLIGLVLFAAALRFATLGHQSLWFDEAFTATHVLHRGLGATLHGVVHTESTPPLYYILAWVWVRVSGDGAFALRSLSALAGVATIPVAWAIGNTRRGRRGAITLAALASVSPLLVWYSQEARAYSLFALFAGLGFWFFLRARLAPEPRARDAWGWAVFSALALLTHYFAAFLIVGEAVLLLTWPGLSRDARRISLAPVAAVVAVTGALVPLVIAQSGHGTQWIGHWAFSSRLIAIPQYLLLGGSPRQDDPLGHGVLALAALPVLAALLLIGQLDSQERRAALICVAVGAAGILLPLLLALAGKDYLAPRNLIGAWLPLAGALAVLLAAPRAGRAGLALGLVICLFGLAVVIAVDVSPRLQRGDWRGVARVLGPATAPRAIVTPELGSSPLEYYLSHLHVLPSSQRSRVTEIDVVGYAPVLAGASNSPAPGFRLAEKRNVHGLIVWRFQAKRPHLLSDRQLRAHRAIATRTEVLVPGLRA